MSVEDRWYHKGTNKPTADYGRGKRYRVRNRGARTESFPDKQKGKAEARDLKIRSDLSQGLIPFDRHAGQISFTDYSTKWLAERHFTGRGRETTAGRIKNHMVPTLGTKRMGDIQPSTVSGWLAELKAKTVKGRPLSATTRDVIWTTFRSIMKSALTDKVIGMNPTTGIKGPVRAVPAPAHPWEAATVTVIIDALPEQYQPLATVAATCGHRQSEAMAVAVEDVDFLRREILVQHQTLYRDGKRILVPPKQETVRLVPLPQITATALSECIRTGGTLDMPCECHPGQTWRVIFHENRHPVARDGLNKAWRASVSSAKQRGGMHQLRHAYASLLIDGGASPKQLQTYLGHKSITTTFDIYGHLFERSSDRARAIVDSAFGGPTPGNEPAGTPVTYSPVYPMRTPKIV